MSSFLALAFETGRPSSSVSQSASVWFRGWSAFLPVSLSLSFRNARAVYFPSSSAMARSILIATNNAHKLQEFREIFAQSGAADIELVSPRTLGLTLEPEETGGTYLENARLKARAFHRPGLVVIADDSGL